MLQLTAAARAKDRAKRLCARCRFTPDFDQFGNRVARLYLGNSNVRELARKRSKAKDDDAGGATNALAVGEKIREGELEFDALT
jgi:hypothetical protein